MWLKWRVMLGIGILPPAIIVMCLTFLPESPRWLISRGRIREGYKVGRNGLLSLSCCIVPKPRSYRNTAVRMLHLPTLVSHIEYRVCTIIRAIHGLFIGLFICAR